MPSEPAGRRTWLWVAGGALIVALAVVALVVVTGDGGDRFTGVDLEARPVAIAAAGDSVWVTTDVATVVRIDGATNEVTATVAVPGESNAVAFGAGSVWVAGADSLSRLDPATAEVVGTVALEGAIDVAASDTAVWALSRTDAGTEAVGIDPATNEVTVRAPLASGTGIAVTDDSVWIATYTAGVVVRLDPTSGAVLAENQVLDGPYSVVAAGGQVWLTDRHGGVARLHPVEAEAVSDFELSPEVDPILDEQSHGLALTDEGLWVLNQPEELLVLIDPDTATQVGAVELDRRPGALAATDDALWILDPFDRSVTRIDLSEAVAAATNG
jgi:streptogramin lyase